jgi:anti-sigma regulatory factor (Ser/Thr protein kinase)
MPDLERVATPNGRQEWSTGLPEDTTAVARARHAIRELLTSWKLLCLLDDAELVTSELVTNMVRHAATPAHLQVQWEGTCLRIAVGDAHPAVPQPRPAGAGASDGRGLQIIDAVAHIWGVDRSEGGKVVWAELRLR